MINIKKGKIQEKERRREGRRKKKGRKRKEGRKQGRTGRCAGHETRHKNEIFYGPWLSGEIKSDSKTKAWNP
jgi:hypothetical protein